MHVPKSQQAEEEAEQIIEILPVFCEAQTVKASYFDGIREETYHRNLFSTKPLST